MDKGALQRLAESYQEVIQERAFPFMGAEVVLDPPVSSSYTETRGGPRAYWNNPAWKRDRTPEQRALDATYQRNAMGVVKGGNAGYIFKSPRKEGESIEDYAKRKAEAEALADRLNKESGLGKYRTTAQGNTRDTSPSDPEASTPSRQSQVADYEQGNVTDPSADRETGQPLGVSPDDAEGIEDIRSRPPTGYGGSSDTNKDSDSSATKNLTDFQKWAKAHPHLAQRVRPGQAGYEDIKDMPEVRSAKQPTAGGIERRTPGPLNNKPIPTSSSESGTPSVASQIQRSDQQKKIQQAADKYKGNLNKVNSGSQNMGGAPSTPGLRAASKLKDYSQKMNNANQGSKPFRSLPEEVEHFLKLTEDWEYIDEVFMTEGLKSWLLKQAPKGWQWIRKNGRRVLQKIKGSADDVAKQAAKQGDDAAAAAARNSGPTRASTILDKSGKPIRMPVSRPAKPPKPVVKKPKPQAGKTQTAKNQAGKTQTAKTQTAKNQAGKTQAGKTTPTNWRNVRDGAVGAGVLGAGGYLAYKNRDALGRLITGSGNGDSSSSNNNNSSSDSSSSSSSDSSSSSSSSNSSSSSSNNSSSSNSLGSKNSTNRKPPSDRLATALRDTQNAITADRKAKEGKNYSGPSTVKKPTKYQSNIGTDFSDLKTEEALIRSLADAYNEICEGRAMGRKRTPEEQAEFDKALAPYMKAREENRKRRENAPGAKGIDWRRGEHHIGDFLLNNKKDKKDRRPKS